ncbi:MmcQ/YjbR family DNA-binding protein [Sciscionella sediminilitoris]|uniref:MmcQ/YjbR family DNA-binding protein n=1 Tax=Sciscionella sediminilitoris TaxID=1445613 RepID=UPI0004DED056|nr:MmcQ/YjbR family DNA-binding protein [Sciscionella sp. SE31]
MPDATRLRALALSLPEAFERETWGKPTFRIGAKLFATLAADEQSVVLRATYEEQAAMLAHDPDTFAVAPYQGRYGWIRVRLATIAEDQLAELVTEAWRQAAPKRLATG